jgi:hypothetical protein
MAKGLSTLAFKIGPGASLAIRGICESVWAEPVSRSAGARRGHCIGRLFALVSVRDALEREVASPAILNR